MEKLIAESISNSVICAIRKAINLSGLKGHGKFFELVLTGSESNEDKKLFAYLKIDAEGKDPVKIGMFLQSLKLLLERESIKTILKEDFPFYEIQIFKPSRVIEPDFPRELKLKVNGEDRKFVCRKRPKKLYRHKIKVRFRDLDAMGHVSNNVFLVYLEEARVGFRDYLSNKRKGTLEFSSVVASHSIDYYAPIFLGEELIVEIFISHLTEKSYRFNYRILNGKTKELKAIAFTQMVGYDYKKQVVKPLPSDFVFQVEDYIV